MQIRASAGETCPAWADWPVKWRHRNGQGEHRALTGQLSPLPARTFQVPSLDDALMQLRPQPTRPSARVRTEPPPHWSGTLPPREAHLSGTPTVSIL